MKKILVVGDDKNILRIVKHILISSGFLVKTHSTVFNLPAIVMRYHPAIVLLEKNIAAKLDSSICIELDQTHTELSIILFSADVEQENLFYFDNKDGFYQKPVEIKNLMNNLNLHLN